MGAPASWLIAFAGIGAARRFERAARAPVESQKAKLDEILARNRDTEYGRRHGFASIRSMEDWRRAVPVVTYEEIEPLIRRVTEGEKNVLTADDPVMFARTSGTTGEPKFVPVTARCQGRDHDDQIRTWLHHARLDHPSLWSGKCLSLVSPAVEGHTPCGLPYGSTSGHIYRNLPAMMRSTYAIPYEAFEIEDYEAKYYAIMRLGVPERVSFLCTANPSSIVKMCEMADKHSELLLKDVADGTLSSAMPIPSAARAVIEQRLRPRPDVARRLERARSRRDGYLLPADYWPDLALIGCWKGGTVGAYLERFPGWFDPDGREAVAVRDWGYLSSEARGSIPLSDVGAGGVLTVATNVFEFVPVSDVEEHPNHRERWTYLGVDQVELGNEYYILLTTTGGLYRYDINDVVLVTDTYHRTPVIEFRRKGRGITSITGEKVSVNQVIRAIEDAAHEIGVVVDHFKAEADVKHSRYVFKVESRAGVPDEKLLPFLHAVDANLARQNLEYDAKRRSLRLGDPVLHVMKPGWYDNQKKRLVAQGRRIFQAKTVILSLGRDARDPDLARVVDFGTAG